MMLAEERVCGDGGVLQDRWNWRWPYLPTWVSPSPHPDKINTEIRVLDLMVDLFIHRLFTPYLFIYLLCVIRESFPVSVVFKVLALVF